MKSGGMRPKMARKAGGVDAPRTPIRGAMESVRPGVAKKFAAGGAAKERLGELKTGKVTRG